MELKVFTRSGKPLTELSKRQQKRFAEMIQNESNEDVRYGLRLALAILGYEIAKECNHTKFQSHDIPGTDERITVCDDCGKEL